MFVQYRSKPEIGWMFEFAYHKMNMFDARKNDVRVCLMNDLVNLVKAFWV